MSQNLFYIVDIRPSWKANPYVTVWRPDNKGYAYPLSWAGKYSQEKIDAEAEGYYSVKEGGKMVRFPVPCEVVERWALAPEPGRIDGNAGPVVPTHPAIVQALRKARYRPRARRELREAGR
jgi:hypothetical protein